MSEKIQYTPGPWRYEPYEGSHQSAIIGDCHQIATTYYDGMEHGNARLIARSPELLQQVERQQAINAQLLAALEQMVDAFGGSLELMDRLGPDLTCADGEFVNASVLRDREDIIDAARLAISAARGTTQETGQ